ncbi:complement factor H-related protein 2-like [Odontesthes bonariensis]|uniref:complement factor H-related protein 2-like n=1 Tax=Odontesthes bonariensis TaxID=219752 RepID=UPI003F58352F
MWVRCLGFALLVWIPGMLHAQQPCSAPKLNTGYFLPFLQSYPHQTSINYACDNKLKPVGEGWWATSTCQNGKWIHEPQCIDENSCLPLNIPNAENPKSLKDEVLKLPIKCNAGYISINNVTEIECMDGTWSEAPVCKKSITACSEPPSYPNAVINNHKYKEVFAENSNVRYQCKDGYATEDRTTMKSITCKNGEWTEGPKCKLSPSTPSPSGSEDEGTTPSFTTSKDED